MSSALLGINISKSFEGYLAKYFQYYINDELMLFVTYRANVTYENYKLYKEQLLCFLPAVTIIVF